MDLKELQEIKDQLEIWDQKVQQDIKEI